MNYDYLAIKNFDERKELIGDKEVYFLSFSDEYHLKVSYTAKKIIECFDGKNNLLDISTILEKNNINISINDLEKFINDFLIKKKLIVGMDDFDYVKNPLLWLKIPLFDSNKISFIFNKLKCLFDKSKFSTLLVAIILCLFISVYNFFVLNTDKLNFNMFSLLFIGLISLIFHECGHVAAGYKKGIRAGKIGIGMYLLMPVCYVDMSNAWRIESSQRTIINLGGIFFQVLTTLPITLLALITDNISLYTINIYIYTMAIYNMLPFMKLDGYWLFCDYFNVTNISTNAFKIFTELIKLKKDKQYTSSYLIKGKEKYQLIFASLYLFSTIFMLTFLCINLVNSFNNLNEIIRMTKILFENIVHFNLMNIFNTSNSLLPYLIPIIIFIIIVSRTIKILLGKTSIRNN